MTLKTRILLVTLIAVLFVTISLIVAGKLSRGEVEARFEQTALSGNQTNREADTGERVVEQTIDTTHALAKEVENAADVIQQLWVRDANRI
jgi:methyl-accepting chemotaxis protein